jgi:hypothetical protein
MANDLAMVGRIYALADQPWDDRARAAVDAYQATHPRGRHGGVHYEFDVLGLDRAEREQALSFYTDRFRS